MTLARPLAASRYVDPEVFEAERLAVFRREWLVLAALDAIPDGHARAVEVAGLPFVVRREGDQASAFVNVCRHRAGPLVWSGEVEPCPRFRCKYHGWQYDPEGRLVRTPQFGADPPDAQLQKLTTRTWRGLVFGTLAAAPAPLQPRLDALAAGAGALDWSDWRLVERRQHTIRCNWKTYIENYLEGYHIPFLHPSLSREVALDGYEVQTRDRVISHVVAPREGAVYAGFWGFVWPNTALNVYEDGLSLERIVPVAPDRTVIDYTYLFAPDATDAARQAGIAMSEQVTVEDIAICEAVQANLASGLYTPGWLSPRHEGGVAAFQQWVREALD